MTEIEILPRGILLWRSLTHWMGGMGIIVLSLAVLPFLGVSGMEMYKAEVPGVTAEKITPRLHQTAMRLWGVYVFLTLLETLFLLFGGMSLFDAFCQFDDCDRRLLNEKCFNSVLHKSIYPVGNNYIHVRFGNKFLVVFFAANEEIS